METEKQADGDRRDQTAFKVPRSLTKLYIRVVSPYVFGVIILSVAAVLLWGWTIVRSVQSRYLQTMLGDVITNTYPIIILLVAALGIAGIMLANTLSRRISGQIYRLERDILSVAAGKETEIKLRQGDELGRVAIAINEAIKTIKNTKHSGSEGA